MPARASLVCTLVASLVLPDRVVGAQDPVAADRDLDGVADASDACPDTYGAPPSGCPPQAPPPVTDRDGDGVRDDADLCPGESAATPNGCPIAPIPEAPPPVDVSPVDPNDEYQTLLRTLPNDYDLGYTFDAPARKRNRENDPGRVAKRIRSLGIAGSSLLLVGTAGLITTLATGLAMANGAKKDLEGMAGATTPLDGGAREDALRRGSVGNKVAVIGSASSGGVMAIGAALLLAARSLKKKSYDTTPTGTRGGMDDKTRRSLTVYGSLLLLYGLIGVGVGAVLARRDDEKKARNGKIVLGLGGAMAGLGVVLLIPLAINKVKKTSRLQTGPMWVRGGGGASVRLSF